MNLNFVNANTFPGDIIALAREIDAGTGVEDIGKGASFADRLMAVLSPETTRGGKISGEEIQGTVDEDDGKDMMLPISGLPFVLSILAALQVPEQVSARLIADAKQEGEGIDLDRLINGLQTLQKESFFSGVDFDVDSQAGGVEQMFKSLGLERDEGDTGPLTLGGFVSALEKLRISSEMTAEAETEAKQETGSEAEVPGSLLTLLQIPEQGSGRLDGETMEEESGIALGRLIEKLHALESEQSDTGQPAFSGFMAALEQLDLSSGLINGTETDLKPGARAGMENNLVRPVPGTHDNGKQERNANFAILRDLVAALEKMDISPEPTSLERFSSKLTGENDVESILGSLMSSISRNKGQSMETGGRFEQAEFSPGQISQSNSMDLFGAKGDPKFQTPSLPEMQAGVDLEFPRSLENLAAVIKEMKNSVDDTRMMEQGITDRQMAKEPAGNVAAIDSSGGAGGEFRQMGMDSRGQSVADAGTPRGFLPAHVTGQVGKSLARAVSQGDTELKLQLKPPELGRIIMTIDNVGTSLKVSVVTESHAAKEILAAHVNELKATLANSGISIDSFDVEMGSDFSQSMADARQQSKGSNSKRGRTRDDGIEEVGDDSKIDARGFTEDVRSLHFVA